MVAFTLKHLCQLSASHQVQDLEHDLERELLELTRVLEEYDTQHDSIHKVSCSVLLPKDISHFRKERELIIKEISKVSEAQPLRVQADEMRQEMLTAECKEYTIQSIPLLLLHYFTERIQNLILSKHLHMLRWHRFSEHSGVVENMYPFYKERLLLLMAEYQDCIQRANRLAVVRDNYIAGKQESSVSAVTMEDLLIYLRWLVWHHHSSKRFNQYIRVLQWLPMTHRKHFISLFEQNDQEEKSLFSNLATCDEKTFSYSKSNLYTPGFEKSMLFPQYSSASQLHLHTMPLSSNLNDFGAAHFYSPKNQGCLPLMSFNIHDTFLELSALLTIYGINYDVSNIKDVADEMELYFVVNKAFRQLFAKQEKLFTFYTYDHCNETSFADWKCDALGPTFIKESNWLPYVTLSHDHDLHQELHWTELRQHYDLDGLLNVISCLCKLKDADRLQDMLKEHVAMLHDAPDTLQTVFGSHQFANSTHSIWMNMYNKFLPTNSQDMFYTKGNLHKFENNDAETDDDKLTGMFSSCHQQKESFDYTNSVRALGLDSGMEDLGDSVTQHGALLSLLHLRFLRIRDLQHSCLRVLNYFRSIERTLTIYDGGLSLEGDVFTQRSDCSGCLLCLVIVKEQIKIKAKKHYYCKHILLVLFTSGQNHRRFTEFEGGLSGGGLACHAYIHNSPADFKIAESEFLRFSEIQNHDDFYSVHDDKVYVQNEMGHYIMYDSALEDFKDIESELLLVASHFLQKDSEHRSKQIKNHDCVSNTQIDVGDFDIASYAHKNIDRFRVIFDIWTNECAFQEEKMQLLNCYYEAYQHISDLNEKRALASTITQIMHRRPRFDFAAKYFVSSYRVECCIFYKEMALLRDVLDKQIEDERLYIQQVCPESKVFFGMPSSLVNKHPISINFLRPTLKNIYMMEFHPSLAFASRIHQALSYANLEVMQMCKPDNVLNSLLLELRILDTAKSQWVDMPRIGKSYSDQLDKDLFAPNYAEDPLAMCDLVSCLVHEHDKEFGSNRLHKERQLQMIDAAGRIMEVVTLRHRLLDVSWECEILSEMYVNQAREMGYDSAHLNMRLVPFEYASCHHSASSDSSTFITAVNDNDSAFDKYSPLHRTFAIYELDEGHVGRFSFSTRDGLLQVLRPTGIENLQVVLKAQLVQKNALASAVLQVMVCQHFQVTHISGKSPGLDTKSEKSSTTQLTSLSGTTGSFNMSSTFHISKSNSSVSEAFMSLQLEKTPCRDIMLNQYLARKKSTNLSNHSPEIEKLKRKCVSEFCDRFLIRASLVSMRAQLMSYYNSIRCLLERFPFIRETYFVEGLMNERKECGVDDIEGLTPNPRKVKSRPRRLLSKDGCHVLNIWFIPHYTEVLIVFKHLDDVQCSNALSSCLAIVSSLHDILHYLCALAQLGSVLAGLSFCSQNCTVANWGGKEGIGTELLEIQRQVDALHEPTDPNLVQELLRMYRDVMLLKFDIVVRHCIPDTFIHKGNWQAFQMLNNKVGRELATLSNVQRPSLSSIYISVPEPLEPCDLDAKQLFPWRSFIAQEVANGELLGVTLLLEDVLQNGLTGSLLYGGSSEQSALSLQDDFVFGQPSIISDATPFVGDSASNKVLKNTCGIQQPLERYYLLKYFLMLWKCLEMTKIDWGCRRLAVKSMSSMSEYREFRKLYRVEVLAPMLQSVARRLGQGEMYSCVNPEVDNLEMPEGSSEIALLESQLVHLLELMEIRMIWDVRKRVASEMSLSAAESVREETALPTDLWKHAVMKESFTTNRPHIAADFVDMLMSDVVEADAHLTFPRHHLLSCLSNLGRNVMSRERHNYESYAMYYENLLKGHHRILYEKEQGGKHLRQQLMLARNAFDVELECEMGNRTHSLIMETIALRAKVYEMRQQAMVVWQEVHEGMKKEFNDVIHDMFSAHSQLQNNFDEFREKLHDDVLDKINETRNLALLKLSQIALKFSNSFGEDTCESEEDICKQLSNGGDNHDMKLLIIKMKAMFTWRHNHLTNRFHTMVGSLKKELECQKRRMVKVESSADYQIMLLQQQLVIVKRALSVTKGEARGVQRLLDRELKEKDVAFHVRTERERGNSRLELVKAASLESMVAKLRDKDQELNSLLMEQNKSSKALSIINERVRKDIGHIKRRFVHERSLKLDAFYRVDQLQSQVYDCVSTSVGVSPAPSSLSPGAALRAKSARTSDGHTGARRFSSAGVCHAPPKYPSNYFADDTSFVNHDDDRNIQRPKTVGGRVHRRGAQQRLSASDLEPDHQQSVARLDEFRVGGLHPAQF